jgi:DNA-binding CsgD family transcriptional regulator
MAEFDFASYERVFRVLERCDGAASVDAFRVSLLEALVREYKLRHATFYSGANMRSAFADQDSVVSSGAVARRLRSEYQEYWHAHDVFALPPSLRLLESTRVASLRELGRLPEHGKAFVSDFLYANALRSVTVLALPMPGGGQGLVGLLDADDQAVGPAALRVLRQMARQLSVISRSLPESPSPVGANLPLTERQHEVARLVADGMSNAVIATRLCLSENTVKKYVSRILNVTGYRSRTELAARMPIHPGLAAQTNVRVPQHHW